MVLPKRKLNQKTDCCSFQALPALVRFGSDYLKRNFLAPAIAGDYISCVGVSEISGGSDVAALKTSAKKVGDDYVINGKSTWWNGVTQT